MNEKRFTTVELPKPNKWGIWYDGACLSTYQVCTLLNEYVDCRIDNETRERDTTPVVPYWISDEAPVIFREIHDMIHQGKGNLFIAFEMGSIRLDLKNTSNYIEVNRTYIKIYNDETGETSVIRNDKITGFIYEPEPELNFEDLKEAINDRLEEMEE